MSVFHRIDDIYTMEATVFMRRVDQLAAYDGALRLAVRHQHAHKQQMAVAVSDNSVIDRPVATEADEAALWDAYRQQRYAKFLAPGERPRQVSVEEGMKMAAEAFQGVN